MDKKTGGYRSKTLEDHHAGVALATLGDGVPDLVKDMFTTAQNLVLYSWFIYPFNMVGELKAFAVLEFALRWQLGLEQESRHLGLGKLMTMAIDEGRIRDDGLAEAAHAETDAVDFLERLVPNPDADLGTGPHAFVRGLATALPKVRNKLAHGSPLQYPGGYVTLAVIARLIDQLYIERVAA